MDVVQKAFPVALVVLLTAGAVLGIGVLIALSPWAVL